METTSLEENQTQRHRSSRRLRHEAEADVFVKSMGDLEQIRQSLGLRPSQISEILKVHPSAWTRWVKEGKAPPHIYQMLQWYIELLSWRGQNSPITGTSIIQQRIRKELPESYLPEVEPLEIEAKMRKIASETRPELTKFIRKSSFYKIIALLLILQAIFIYLVR
ncbi:MAG: hypothetical protein IPM57_06250 [Oligoflexia bacterium]|nr:hypothetical protein [Oligoflexia bacterium]